MYLLSIVLGKNFHVVLKSSTSVLGQLYWNSSPARAPLSRHTLLTKVWRLLWNDTDGKQSNESCNHKFQARKKLIAGVPFIWLVCTRTIPQETLHEHVYKPAPVVAEKPTVFNLHIKLNYSNEWIFKVTALCLLYVHHTIYQWTTRKIVPLIQLCLLFYSISKCKESFYLLKWFINEL